jgi:uncharacterized protein (TIGR02145 family)
MGKHPLLNGLVTASLLLFSACSEDSPTKSVVRVPVLTTASSSAITQTTAQSGGTITSDGGAAVSARGVCWSSSPTPTVADSKTIDGTGTGSFISSLTGLTDGALYHVRAYATNSAGTAYGDSQSFTTSAFPVTDIDGNVYQAVTIGTQVWMKENLRVTHYRNGEAIPKVTDAIAWVALTTGAYCEYANDVNIVATYGRLYNWYVVADSRNIAPAGWHVPTDADWKQLEMALGMSQAEADGTSSRGTTEGGKLKEADTTHWFAPNEGATNESGFTALPASYRGGYDEAYFGLGYYAFFWTSTDYNSDYTWHRYLAYLGSDITRGLDYKESGFSVRCVRDH